MRLFLERLDEARFWLQAQLGRCRLDYRKAVSGQLLDGGRSYGAKVVGLVSSGVSGRVQGGAVTRVAMGRAY